VANYKIEGMKELEKLIKELGKLPQKTVNKAAISGATIALKSARENAPKDKGELEQGIILKAERNKAPGKKVYQITMDKSKNDIFVKESKDGNRAYYPASQEYGFLTRDGGYVQGEHFMRNSIDDNATQIEKKIVDKLTAEIDKLR